MDEEDNVVSFRARVKGLAVGGTESVAKRFDLDTATRADIADSLDKMLNSITSTVGRLKTATGQDYTVEHGQFSTRTKDIVVAVAVTRVA